MTQDYNVHSCPHPVMFPRKGRATPQETASSFLLLCSRHGRCLSDADRAAGLARAHEIANEEFLSSRAPD
jgi:hypothetical protein